MKIKNKKTGMRKTRLSMFLGFIMITLFSMMSVFAGSFITDETRASTIASDSDKSNVIQTTIFSSDNNNFSVGNTNGSYDYEFTGQLTDSLYFQFDKTGVNATSIIVYAQWGDNATPELKVYNITMTDNGLYTFVFQPEIQMETLFFRIDYPESEGTFIEYFHFTRQEGVTSTTSVMIGFVADLIEINLSIWRLGYYVIIFGIIVSLIFSIIYLIAKAIEWAEKMKTKRKRN